MAVVEEKITFALDPRGAQPSQSPFRRRRSICGPPTARDELGVKLNCDLNGYQFSEFNEHYICREELPNGSNTFQRVLDEITEDLETMQVLTVTTKPMPTPPNPRRKSIATPRCSQPTKSNSSRRVRWGGTSVATVESSFQRPRVLSDGAITGNRHRKDVHM